jgi:hypothetical protein
MSDVNLRMLGMQYKDLSIDYLYKYIRITLKIRIYEGLYFLTSVSITDKKWPQFCDSWRIKSKS